MNALPDRRPSRAARVLQTLLLVASVATFSAACDDDPKPSQPATNNGDLDTGTNNGGGDTGTNNGGDDVTADVEPDAPVPQNDEERILFIDETESWTFDELHGDVQVVRTAGNVPHVFATDRHDLGYVLGFIVARDRYFVMDLQRRLSTGTISELLGDLALANDLESRYMGMAEVSRRIWEGLSDDDRAYFEAYAGGVNAYIDRVVTREVAPPSEIQVAGGILGSSNPADLMKPFTGADIAAMVTAIVFETNFETSDVGRNADAQALEGLFADAPDADLRRAGAMEEIWDNLAPPFSYASAPTAGITDNGPGRSNKPQRPGVAPTVGPLRPGLGKSIESSMLQRATRRADRLKQLLGRKEAENFGSNTWAVDGAHTPDGFALVAGDGHLPLYVPSLMFQIGLNTELFGGGDIHQAGLLITSLPLLAVGTNGSVAWSQVNPVADITDWYREELELVDGLPARSRFQGAWRDLESVEEVYEIADIPLLGSVGRTENVKRYKTFDGRFIWEVEGRPYVDGDALAEGEAVMHLPGGPIVPGDVDDDGVVTAISFDYTAFDLTGYVSALGKFTEAKSVYDYQDATRGLIGNMLYSAVADGDGNILYSSYQAVPCRTYLPRDPETGRWMPGADPTLLIDGTLYGGFTIPSDAEGHVDESFNDTDPSRCVVPFDRTPQVINPVEGYVANANNQPAPLTDDGRLDDDDVYIGGPWACIRADTIASGLADAVATDTATVDTMAAIQGTTRSRLGEMFTPFLRQALDLADRLANTAGPITIDEQRIVDLWTANAGRFTEARTRMEAWQAGRYATPSGVETFYSAPTDADRQDAVATMIFNAWLPRAISRTFDDEGMNPIWRFQSSRQRFRTLQRYLSWRSMDNAAGSVSWSPATGESVFFDDVRTPELERSDEVLLLALVDALDFLASAPTGKAEGGFGTEDMDAWIWGLRHQVRFESLLADFLPPDSDFSFLTDLFSISTSKLPLAANIPAGDPRRDLKWFPRPGDNYGVDAASPGFSGTRFTYGSGPVMRMVIAIKDGQVRGQNIIPGGQSGLSDSPFFSDQAAMWLGNQTMPLRYHIPDIAAGAVGREVYKAGNR